MLKHHTTSNRTDRFRSMTFGGFLLAGLAALALPLAPTAAAQQVVQAEYSQDELRAFAHASLALERLNERWMPEISDAATVEEADALKRRAQDEMMEAVKAQGISITQYNEIYDSAQANPQIAETIDNFRRDAR